ncbi:hypothetical protein ACFPRL_22770 [Pseudoclavibacter helvolus]
MPLPLIRLKPRPMTSTASTTMKIGLLRILVTCFISRDSSGVLGAFQPVLRQRTRARNRKSWYSAPPTRVSSVR